jgi:hypothetical protein
MWSKLLSACADAPLTQFCSALSAGVFSLHFGATAQSVKPKPRPNGIAVVLSALASAGLETGTAQDNASPRHWQLPRPGGRTAVHLEWSSIQTLVLIGSRSGGDNLLYITIYSALGT